MLGPNVLSGSRVSRIIIYAIFTTTIFLITAAGSNAAVFSFQDPLTDLFGTKPVEAYTFLVPPPAPTFGYNYTVAGSASGFDATVDSLGNLYSAYESGGNIYLKKNLGEAELVSPGSGPVITIDLFNNIHVIYSNSGLKYKKKTGAVWESERAVAGGTVFYSIDTDSTGAAHIASDDGGTGGRGHVVYVKDNAGTWSAPIFDWWGWYDSDCRCGNYYHLPVIRIDGGDKYHLAYEFDNWGGQASWSEKAINIASNSAYGDKGVGGFGWNAGVGLTRNSLTLNGSDAYIAYTSGGTQNIALVNASWTVLNSFAGSAGSAYYRSGVVGVSYVAGNIQYIEDAGAGFSDPADLGAGSGPVALLGSRYVFFQNGTDIKLASSEAFDAPKAITGFDLNALSPPVIGVVNESAKTVSLTVPFGTNVTALVPTITHTGASVNPASGVANNFTTAQTYTVTATDASTQAYVVTVTVEVPPDVVFNASGNLATGTYNNITVNSPAVVTVTGDVVVNGCVTVNGGTLLMGGSTFTGPGCFSLSSGATLGIGSPAGITSGAAGNVQTATRTFDPGATYVYNGNSNQFAGNALPSPVVNLTIANTGGVGNEKVTGNAGQAVTGLLRVQQGTYASASDYADVQIDAAGTLSLAAPITVSGNWTNNGTFISNGFGVTLDGTTAQSIGGVSVTGFSNLTDSNTSAAVTFNSNFNVSGTFNMNGAGTVFIPGSPTVQINSAGNTGTISGNGRVQVTRLSSNPFSSQYRFFTFNVTALTVEWAGAGDQNIENGVAGYGGITVSGGGTKTIGGSGTLAVNGNVTVFTSTNLAQGFNTLNITGNWNNGGGFVPGTAPVGVIFSGSGDQTITTGGSGTGKTFGLLTIAKSGGTASLAGYPMRCSTLTVSSGTFDTSAASSYAVTATSDVSITGGTFIANNSAVTAGGKWTNTGTFTAGGSTVTFNGSTGQTIAGNTSFYNLVKSITTPAQTLFFAAGSTTAATNSLTFAGTSGNLLSLRSTVNGTQWNLSAPATQSVSFVDVKDSNASGGNMVNQTDSVNSGNNVNWAFAVPVLNVNDVTQTEGDAGTKTFRFTVSLSVPSGGVTFDIATADGTAQDNDPATEDNDYVGRSLTSQAIVVGDSTYTFDVTVNGDTLVEPNENFFVNVTNVTGATLGDGQGIGTISNDDCIEAPSGMVSMWKGENNPLDRLGRNNAVLMNSAAYAPGLVGQAFSFDGVDDYIEIPDSASLGLTGGLTLEAWVKQRTVGFGTIFSKADDNGSEPISSYGLQINPAGAINVALYGTYPADNWTTGPGLVAVGQWNHIALTWDGTYGPADNVKLYVNGALSQSWTKSGTPLNVTTQTLTIGSMKPPTYYGHLDGLIDEPAIFDRALSGAEIAAIYNVGSAGFCDNCTATPVGLVSWWTGDGNGLDSRSVNNATLQNGATYSSGKVGQAVDLNGLNQYVRISAPVSLPVGNQPRTMELWFKTPVDLTTSTEKAIIQYGSAVNGQMFGLITTSNATGKLYFFGYNADLAGPTTLLPNQWYHGVVTYDGTNVSLYLNGVLEAFAPLALNTVIDINGVTIGHRPDINTYWTGQIDEPAIYDRALTPAEIAAIYSSSTSGKCKPTATTPPAGIVGWWPGDGYISEFPAPGRFASLVNGAGYAVGKVGQSFSLDGVDDYIEVADSVYDPGPNAFSVEFWLKSRNNGVSAYLIGKSHPDGGQGWDIRLNNNRIELVGVNGWGLNLTSDASVSANTWHHIAMSSTETLVSLYIDGVLKGTCPRSNIGLSVNPLRFGFTTDYGGTPLSGILDEVTLYNRAITPAEIEAIVNAGLAGKLKQMATLAPVTMTNLSIPSAPNDGVYAFPGDATILFPVVTASGITHQIPLDPAQLPPLPMGATPTGLTYDIATSAIWSGTPSVCFNVPALAAVYRNLRILHLEYGVWVNRTQVGGVSPALCSAGLTSLSPFAIVDFGPTAANVSISGRAMTQQGNGVLNAIVQLTDQHGMTRTARTGSFGYYRFDGVATGETYVIGVASKRFTFIPRTITVADELTDVDLIAESP